MVTRVSGSTRMGRVRIRVRTVSREEVIKVIVRFIRWRWEEKRDSKEMGARRARTKDRKALIPSSLFLFTSHSKLLMTGRAGMRASRAMRATSGML